MSNNAIIPFSFEDAQVRVIKDEENNPWFVVRDICNVLEINQPAQAVEKLDTDEVSKRTLVDSLGKRQEMLVISESGLYALIMRSNKPKAREFRKWITSEVIPSIRKTGSYTLPISTETKPSLTVSLSKIRRDLRDTIEICLLMEMDANHAKLAGANVIKNRYSVDLAEITGQPLMFPSIVQKIHLNVTNLGAKLSLSAIRTNKLLVEQGFQVKGNKNNPYIATEKGKPFSILIDTGKAHNSGQSIQTLHWYEDVIDLLIVPSVEQLIDENQLF